MKRIGLLTSFILLSFAASPLQAGKELLICVVAPDICFGGGGDPVMPAPPPPPEIGHDPILWPPVHEAVDDALPPYDLASAGGNADPTVHAFSMIADSRTHLAYASSPINDFNALVLYGFTSAGRKDFAHWDQRKLLGQYRTDCSGGRIGIHNAAISGTTAQAWENAILWARGPQLSKRVVLMIGGNDVIKRTDEYQYIQFLPYVGTAVRQKTTGDIHKYIQRIVLALAWSGREVIVQRHFMANPGEPSLQSISVSAGLHDLNDYAYRDFGPDVVTLIPPKLVLVWRLRWVRIKVGGCPFCFHIPMFLPWPALEWTPWQVKATPKIPGVSFAHIRTWIPQPYFLDGDYKHLNYKGYQLHATDLKHALWNRCWW